MNPKVSVCIPVYNVERFIARCIQSLQHQSLEDIEIIVVNDCTLDNSMNIVKSLAVNDSRIKIIEHDENCGLMVARRSGYMAATGDYITFCDSDDALPKDALYELYFAAVKEKADIVSGKIEYILEDGETSIMTNKLKYGSDKVSVLKSLLKDEFLHNLCSKLFSRKLLQDYNYQTFTNAINGEDGMLFYQIVVNSSRVVTIESVVYQYYANGLSSTHVKLSQNAINNIVLCNKIREEVCMEYDSLKILTFRRISKAIFYHISCGYKKEIKKALKKYQMESYARTIHMIKYFSFLEIIKLKTMTFCKTILYYLRVL